MPAAQCDCELQFLGPRIDALTEHDSSRSKRFVYFENVAVISSQCERTDCDAKFASNFLLVSIQRIDCSLKFLKKSHIQRSGDLNCSTVSTPDAQCGFEKQPLLTPNRKAFDFQFEKRMPFTSSQTRNSPLFSRA